MKYTLEQNLSVDAVSEIIENAKQAVICRNSKLFFETINGVWSDIEREPDFSLFEEIQEAELLRWAGSFLNFYGKAKNLPFYQERAKNLLTKAINLFSKNNLPYKIAEANVSLALCYYYEGAIDETEAILEQTKLELSGNQLHPVYLLVCTNRMTSMISKREYQKVFEIIDEISVPMEFCEELDWLAVFHEKVGLASKNTGQFERAIYHYLQGIKCVSKLNNLFSLCSFSNNLANLYLKIGELELAHKHINKALKIANDNDFVGFIPHFLDTKALIYQKEGFLELSIQSIDQAIFIFKNGEDANGLTEALWNKCKFLLALERKEEAITLFGQELIPIATQQMGEFAVKNFVKEFSELVHIKNNGTFEEEIRRFKRVEIVNALRETKYNLYDAADFLKIEPNLLVQMIDDEFPELYQEFGILRISDLLNQNANQIQNPPNISEICLESGKIISEQTCFQELKTFYFSQNQMETTFNISQEAVVSFSTISKIPINDFVLVKEIATNSFFFGKINYDNDLRLYFLESKTETFPISLDDFQVIGEPFGYFPFEEINQETLKFRTF